MSQYIINIPLFLSKQALKESLKYKQMLKDMKEFWVIEINISQNGQINELKQFQTCTFVHSKNLCFSLHLKITRFYSATGKIVNT